MEYKIGDTVCHKLTAGKFLIIGYSMGKIYHCRSEDYREFFFEEEELYKN